jgi:molybdopterin synthase catalytic subunit
MIRIQTEDFDVGKEYQSLRETGSSTGAICCFTGLVRDFGDKNGVLGLFLEHYPGMTEKALESTLEEARSRWPLQAISVIHRVGELHLTDQIVFVGVASAHREAAFAACEFIMDYLKVSAPFWKKELGQTGSHWVESKDSDEERARRWESS